MSILRINNNLLASNAVRNLRNNSSMLARALERLSSGLRINHAADDVSGFSISERLRSQINGLNRAASNSLTGISLLQTADSSLNETSTLISRIRDLAVQASDGALTSNDRLSIQSEVSQLLDEIDRIAASTEFNNKMLLDGTLSALITSKDPTLLKGIQQGNIRESGSYVLNFQATNKGALEVQKTGVFNRVYSANSIGAVNFLQTFQAGAAFVSEQTNGISQTGITEVVVVNKATNVIANQNKSVYFYTISDPSAANHTMSLALATDRVSSLMNSTDVNDGDYLQFSFIVNNISPTAVVTGHVSFAAANAGVQFTNVTGIMAAISTMFTNAGALAADATTTLSAQGQLSIANTNANIVIKGIKFVDGSLDSKALSIGVASPSDLNLSFGKFGGNQYVSNILWGSIGYKYIADQATARTVATSAANPINRLSISDGANNILQIKFANNVFDQNYVTDNLAGLRGYGGASGTLYKDASVNIANKVDTLRTSATQFSVNELQKVSKVQQISAAPQTGTYLVSAVSGTSYAVYNFDNTAYDTAIRSGQSWANAVEAARGNQFWISTAAGVKTFNFHIGQVFNGDNARDTSTSVKGDKLKGLRLAFTGTLQAGESGTLNLNTTAVKPASQNDLLSNIDRISSYDIFSGRDTLEVQFFIRGSSQSSSTWISKTDTLQQMAGKISLALVNFLSVDDLNLETGVNQGLMPNLVHINTVGLAQGTISITTPVPGKELLISGDQDFLNMLALTNVQQARAPVYSVTAYNLTNGQVFSRTVTNSAEISGFIPGVKLIYDPAIRLKLDPRQPLSDANSSITAFPNIMANSRPEISTAALSDLQYLDIVPTGLTLQVGANYGQTIKTQINQMSTEALGIKGLLVVNESLAGEALTRLDDALNRVLFEQSKIGAIQNRLESTVRNLEVAAENYQAAESQIRDADVAKELINITRLQILSEAGVAAVAQANTLPSVLISLLDLTT